MFGWFKDHFYLGLVLGVITAIVIAYSYFSTAPKVRASDIPQTEFSAERAFVELDEILAENHPHPVGSAANKIVRDRIWEKLIALGLEPELQVGLSCSAKFPGCAEVENIIAVKHGTGNPDAKAIMLATHYDSVPASAGAGDDISGVAATLEIIRILSTAPALTNDVVILITDGEETGLRGAMLFAQEHPLMQRIAVVINLEARGVTGLSNMFETGPDNQNLMAVFAKAVKRPAANSLAVEIYQRMPNDTDYSIYKEAGANGLNFAFAGGVSLYHSVRDSPAHLDQRSLQHHGDNAYEMINALGNIDLENLNADGNSTYFDLFTKKLIVWPSAINVPLAAGFLLLLSFFVYRLSRFSGIAATTATISLLGLLVLPVLAGWLLSYPLGIWVHTHPLDHPYPWPGRIVLLTASILCAMLIGKISSKWLSAKSLLLGAYWLISLLALVLSLTISGGTYLFLVPVILFAIGLVIDLIIRSKQFVFAIHLGLLGATYMAIYHFFALELVAGFSMSYVKMVPLVLLSLALAPIFAKHWEKPEVQWRAMFGAMVVIILSVGIIASLMPGFTTNRPRGQNLVFIENASTGKAEWVSETSGGQDAKFLEEAGFPNSAEPYNLYGVFKTKRVFKPAEKRLLPAPKLTILSDETSNDMRIITAEISSQREVNILAIAFDADKKPVTVKINDQLAARYDTDGKRNSRLVPIHGPQGNTYTLTIMTRITDAFPITIIDSASLQPAEFFRLAKLRRNDSAPFSQGDRSISVIRTEVAAK
ncbi:MAG: M28 family peptidase [Robiginitomaculum sp.]|nr:M28 family peptidase [Robiginitomaculum sp.]